MLYSFFEVRNMNWLLTLTFLLTIFSFTIPLKAFADTLCQPIYGGGQTCTTSSNISIDKKVLNPKTNSMVDNLGINDPRYQPNFIATFQIKIVNTGNSTLSKVDIKDIFPQYISFAGGDGSFDSNTKTVSISISNLNSNETRTFNVLGRIAAKDQLPQGTVCVVNLATATADNSQTSQDNTQFCIEKNDAPAPVTKRGFPILSPVPVSVSPPTGPESLALFSLIPIALAGFFLRRKSKQ